VNNVVGGIQKYTVRYFIVVIGLVLCTLGLFARAVYLTVIDQSFLKKQGEARMLRTLSIPAYRGMILDRNKNPLAISTPVVAVWINPQDFSIKAPNVNKLLRILKLSKRQVKKLLKKRDREFVYLKRGLSPEIGSQVKALNVSGVYLLREFRRFYPAGAVTAHVLGMTNIDDHGQEGLELAYEHWLRGVSGKKQVIKDRLGHIIADVATLKRSEPGHDLQLSIDRRVQFLAHDVLAQAVTAERAKSGSVVVLDARSGEVLAMVNLPSYNPNLRHRIHGSRYRNRAATDVFEPGSVIKAFTIAAALKSKRYTPRTRVNTAPGWLDVEGKRIHDEGHHAGLMTITNILTRSSNVGVTKVALSLRENSLYRLLKEVGFGRNTLSDFPGESAGQLQSRRKWTRLEVSTLAFGYGLSVTGLQLAKAFTVFANQGKVMPLTLLKRERPPHGKRVLSSKVAKNMLSMLQETVEGNGTGKKARLAHYHVAGKTGTARIADEGGYSKKRHIATFVGLAPVKKPKLIVVVVIREPSSGHYYSSTVAAPVFAKIMGGSLRILNITPDKISA